jgi:hypothetical protein
MGILFVFIIMAFSCASAPKAEAPSSYDISRSAAVSIRETGETIDNDNRMITYSVSLELSVKNTEETRKILIERVKEYKGFIVRESENYITTRIPAENMDNFIVSAKSLGKIEDESKTGTDITDQYRDNIIRLESLRNIRDRYLALLEKANSVSDILNIEKELERINTQIELLEGKIKYAELSVAYSDITVRFKEKAKPGPVGWIFYGMYQGIKWLFIWN